MLSRFITILMYSVIFVTGAAGLIYQVTWHKYLTRLLGSDSIATAVILAAFLGGLSVGYYLCGKLTTWVKNYFKAYAILEIIIGAWCLNFSTIFNYVQSFTKEWAFSPPLGIILQGFFCAVLLMGIPTIAMGGTIPFLTRGISKTVKEATHIHARVYAVNTAGAFLGSLLAGFYLIPVRGLPMTMMETAILNIGAGIFFFILSKITAKEGLKSNQPVFETHLTSQSKSRFSPRILYFIAFLSGFYVMTLENVLIRITSFSLGSSSYTFSLVVSAFILSIAIGSFTIDRFKKISERLLFFNQLFITLTLILVYLSLDTWPYWGHVIRTVFSSSITGMAGYYIIVFLILLLVLIVPIVFMGATVPIIFHEIKRDLKNVGKHSGILFSLNTFGNLTGSLLGGIIFYYVMNNPGIFLSAILLASISTCLASLRLPRSYLLTAGILTILIFISFFTKPFYDEANFTAGTFRVRNLLPFSLEGPDVFFQKFNKNSNLIFYDDGPATTAAVIEKSSAGTGDKKSLSIIVNGKSDSSTKDDIRTLKLLAHIPALFAEKRKNIMIVGLGTGVTAGELLLYPDVHRIDVAEISPSVIKALPYFKEFTNNVHENKKLKIHTGDAFRILGRSRKKWDIIISEPSNPWVSGVELLFSQEFYKLAKEHLTEKGILVQWFHSYSASPSLLGMILNTINQEFQYPRVFLTNSGDLLVMASKHDVSLEQIKRAQETLEENEPVKESLKTISMASVDSILLREIWPPSYINENFHNYSIQTMDNPRLHYLAGKDFFMMSSVGMNYLFDSRTAPYFNDYLLRKKYGSWNNLAFLNNTFDQAFDLKKDVISNHDLLLKRALKLKNYLGDSDIPALTENEKKEFGTDLIPFITDYPANEKDWKKVNLQGASFREKALLLFMQASKSRNWLTPYPVKGLVHLLQKGIIGGKDTYEKNWCVLSLAFLLLNERADKQLIMDVLDHAARDSKGNIIVADTDEGLLQKVNLRLSERK
ncbi:MAG: hypothetical protein HN417_08435 [Desulfobacula sp.]|nr:hypothetical protein [Desulfobacula sp.]MBT7261589.1 hypothetical protein [Desulfobacula sp.]